MPGSVDQLVTPKLKVLASQAEKPTTACDAARLCTPVERRDHKRSRATAGISDNLLEASWKALVDSVRPELPPLAERKESVAKVVEDYCWGV